MMSTENALCKVERMGGEVAMKVIDLFFESKSIAEIVSTLNDSGNDVSVNDVNTFLNKYRGLKEKKLAQNKKLKSKLLQRISKHEDNIDQIIESAKNQLELIEFSDLKTFQKVQALSIMMRTITDSIKTDNSLNRGIGEKATSITQVNIVNQVSKEKQDLREKVLRADFVTKEIDWSEIDAPDIDREEASSTILANKPLDDEEEITDENEETDSN